MTTTASYLSVEETANALGVSPWLIYQQIARQEIPHKRIGRLIRIPAAYINITQGGTL
ncbi:helix-turn-helix domain-containing protein [Trueperella pyogenes]|uniref:helix-turn-helix domain-containing protein n=1 Tax=Trueperella pyogenes TaxID=1661 RepID=UPI00345CD9C9